MEKEKGQRKSSSARIKAKRIFALLLAVAVIGTNYPAELQVKAAPTAGGGTGSALSGTDMEGDGTKSTSTTDGGTIVDAPKDIAGGNTVAEEAAVQEGGTVSAAGDNEGIEIPEEQAEGLPEGILTAVDQTNATDQLSLSIRRVLYKEKGAEETSVEAKEAGAYTYLVDLSALDTGTLETLAIEAEFAIVPAMTEKNIKIGDTFQYVFPADVFKLNDTTEPIPVMNRDGADSNVDLKEQVASYEIKDNVVMVTFTEGIDGAGVSHVLGRIMLPVTLNQEAMNSTTTTDAMFHLQKNDTVDKQYTFTLPKLETDQEIAESRPANPSKNAGGEDKSTGMKESESVESGTSSSESNENKSFFDEVKEGFQKKVTAFTAFFSTFGSEDAVTQKAIANPAAGISKILIAATGKKDGYADTDTDEASRTFQFQMKIQLDQDYLDQVFEESSTDPNFPKLDDFGSEDDYVRAIEDYFTNNNKINPVSYTYSLGDNFTLPTGKDVPLVLDLKNSKTPYETLGKIVFDKDSSGLMTATVTFEKMIYAMIMEEVVFTEELVIRADKLSENKQVLGWTGEGLILKNPSGSAPTENPEDKKAQIVKSGKTNDTGTEFTYTIDVSAPASPAGSTLTGYTVKDILPQLPVTLPVGAQKYMNVDTVLIDGNPIPLKPDADSPGYEIDPATGELNYTYPEDTGSFSEITLKLSLTDEQLKAIDKTGVFNAKIENEATITAKDKTVPDNISNKVSNNVNYTALQKDCQEDPLSGKRYKWTLGVNTYNGRLLSDAYLLDVVDADVHSYTGTGITIDGANYSYHALNTKETAISGAGDSISALNTVGAIQGMLTAEGFTLSANQANYFWYQYTDGSETHYEQVMLLPYKEMGLLGKNVKVQYTTQLNDSQLSTEQTASNRANLVVKYNPGQGPGQEDDFGWNVDKSGTSHPELGGKSGLSYNEKTQKADWRIKVNFYGKDLGGVTVEDVLTDSDQILYPGEKITFIKWSIDAGTHVTGEITEQAEGSAAPYYTLDTASVPGQTKLVFHLGDLAKNEWYDIRYSTQVVNTAFLSGENPWTESNQAVIRAKLGEEDKVYSATANLPVDNTWITKSAVGTYDYTNQLFSWKSTVNPNHLDITNAVVTDAATDSVFNTVTKAVRHPKSGGSEEAAISISNGAGTITFSGGFIIYVTRDGNGKSTFTFPADTINDTFEFEYNTKLANVTANPYTQNANARKQEVTNTIDLTGSHKAVPVTASAQAKNNMVLVPATKDGKYAADDTGKITWNVLVNRDKVDMEGAVIRDDISTKPFFELDRINFAIYKAVLKADGSVDFDATTNAPGNKITDNDGYKDASVTGINGTLAFDKGFTYTIPSSLKYSPLLLVFDTYFIDSITDDNAGDVGNKVTVTKNSNSYETPESKGGFRGTFNIENYAGATKKPILLISKKSSNSQNTSEKDNSLALEGAEFTLESYIKGSGDTYVFNTVTKSAFSQATGNATYVNLKPDIVYKVWENEAPSGYVLDNTPKYFLFLQKGTVLPTSIMIEGTDVINNCVIFQANSASEYKQAYPAEGVGSSPSFTITNTPDTSNEIEFMKLGADGNPLQGSEFTLTQQGGSQVKKISATSGADGKVTFPNVDVNVTYVLQEKKTADLGNDQGATFIVKTSWETDDNKFSYTVTEDPASNKTALVSGDSAAGYKIKNQYRTGRIVLKKADGGNMAALAGVTFRLYTGQSIDSANKIGQQVSAANGTVTFNDVPYSPTGYTIEEVSTVIGYKMPSDTKVMTISKTELDASANAADTGGNLEDGQKKPLFTIDKTGSGSEIKNDRVTGKISLTKVNDANASTVLPDKKFALYYTGRDGYYGSTASQDILVAEGTTLSDGTLEFTAANKISGTPDLVWGTYLLKEVLSGNDIYKPIDIPITKAMIQGAITPSGDKTASGATFALTVNYNDTLNVKNSLKTMNITLNKKVLAAGGAGTYFDNDLMSGVQFTLSGQNAYNENITPMVVSTNYSGTLTFTNVPVSCAAGYTLTETSGLESGYKNPKSYQVVVESVNGAAKVSSVAEVGNPGTYGTALNETGDAITVTNEPRTGSLQFTKKSVTGSNLTALDNSELKDVYFVLGAVNDTVKAQAGNKTPVRIGNPVQSDVNGKITFDNVVYGQKYVLYEKVPTGYTATPIGGYKNLTVSGQGEANGTYVPMKEITKSSNTWTYDANGLNFTFRDTAVINNTLRISNVTLKKVDENGSLLKDIRFTVYRRNSNTMDTDGSGLVMEVPAAAMTYYLYKPAGTVGVVQTGSNGQVILNLPYGDYVAVETLPDDIQSGNDVAVHITIAADGNAVVKQTSQFHNENVTDGTGASLCTLKAAALGDASYWKTTSKNGDNTYTVVNELKYGFVNLYKVSGSRVSDGTPNTLKADSTTALANVEFPIYRDNGDGVFNDGTDTWIADAKTDESGNILRDTSADTYNGKYLVYGTYYLVEKKPAANHMKDTAAYKFEIGSETDGKGDHRGTAWIYTNEDGTYGVAYKKSGQNLDKSENLLFANESIRGTFSLNKRSTLDVPAAGSTITNAEFTVYTNKSGSDVAVASLKYNAISGKYELIPYSGSETPVLRDGNGILYLTQYFAGNASSPPVYKLLQGSYYLEESNIVSGYQKNASKMLFDITNTGLVSGTDVISGADTIARWTGGTEVTVCNTPVRLSVNKLFSTRNETSAEPGGGTIFGLYKEGEQNPSYSAPVTGIKTIAGATSGMAVFTTIEDGTYILRETAADTHIPRIIEYKVVAQNGTIAVYGSKDQLLTSPAATGNGTGEVTLGGIQNYAKGMFSFQKTAETSAGDKGLNGAEFTLTPNPSQPSASPQMTQVSKTAGGTTGMVTFVNILPGNYVLKESSTVDGYVVADAEVQVVVDAEGLIKFYDGATEILTADYKATLTSLFENKQTKISVVKKDETGKNLPGIKLRITPAAGSELVGNQAYYEWTTRGDSGDAANIALSQLLIGGGTYKLEEPQRADGYLAADPIIFTYTRDGQITNVQGAEEGAAAPGGILEKNYYMVQGKEITFVVLNKTIKSAIQLRKEIPSNEQGEYAGIQFDMYQCQDPAGTANPADDPIVETDLILENDGTLIVYDLPEGYYYFRETKTKDTLYLDESLSEVIHIEPNQDEKIVTVDVTNVGFETYVKLTKTDAGDSDSIIGAAGDVVPGTQFTLYEVAQDNTEKQVAQTLTNKDGEIIFTVTKKGAYKVAETKAAKGYILGSAPYTAEFTVDNIKAFQKQTLDLSAPADAETAVKYDLTVTGEAYAGSGISNIRDTGTVTLIKENADKQSLNGVKFELYKEKKAGNLFEVLKELFTGKSYKYKEIASEAWDEQADVEGTLTIGDLPWGKYYIVETGQKDGYALDGTKYEFTIDKTSGTDIQLLVSLGRIVNAYTSVDIKKTDLNGVALYGGVLKLEGDFLDGSTEYQWTTASEAETIVNKLITGEEYTLSEVSAPAGHIRTKETAAIRLNEDGTLGAVKGGLMKSAGNLITVQNKPVTMAVQKYSPLGVRLKGCVFAVTGVFAPDYSGKARMMPMSIQAAANDSVETLIVDDGHPDVLNGRLIVGNIYTLQEQTPPNGYVVGGKVEFKVLENGDIEMISESSEYTLDKNTGRIVMVDDATTLGLAKTDEAGSYLGGAVYTVEGKFADGTDKKEFSPTTAGTLKIHELFIEGEQYTLTETKAPKGYDALDEPVIFNFLARNGVEIVSAPESMASLTSETKQETIEKTVYTINIKNKKTSDQTQNSGNNTDKKVPSVPGGAEAAKAVNTGDTADITNWAILGTGAGAAMVLALVLIRRQKRKQ